MHCKICRNGFTKERGIKVKGGYICSSCFSLLPQSVKLNIESFTTRQIFQLSKIIRPLDKKPWVECGAFAVTKDGISINNVQFGIKHLRSVKLNFHPAVEGPHPNTVIGTVTVIIETKAPHFILEEPFFPNDVTVSYGINKKAIQYYYSYELEKLLLAIWECINDGADDMTPYIDKYYRTIRTEKEFQEKMKAAKKRQQEKNTQKEQADKNQKRKQEENKKNSRKKEKESEKTEAKVKKAVSPFDEAKALFGVEIPYTKAVITRRRNELLKKHHPDVNGGSEEMCKTINKSYELLMKFVIS